LRARALLWRLFGQMQFDVWMTFAVVGHLMSMNYQRALIVGAGSGLGAALARVFTRAGLTVGIAARDAAKLGRLAAELNVVAHACDAAEPHEVDRLFAAMEATMGGAPDVVVYNASSRIRGPLVEVNRAIVGKALAITAYGGFLVAQAAAQRMTPNAHGAIFFTGASASIKGFANSAPFAMGKFALRGLAQSAARELQPQGIHVAHFVIDGTIRNPEDAADRTAADATLDPDAVAQAYLDVLMQDRSAWSTEMELRPWTEPF
jgi:NAD(P)-dependent dehydrogenase (short-subunit alcohol dehydrogenase family)